MRDMRQKVFGLFCVNISPGVKELALICSSIIHNGSDLDVKFRLKGIQSL